MKKIPNFPDFPAIFTNFLIFAILWIMRYFALFCHFWTMITENGYNLVYNWLYIRKAYCFCFNLRGHNYFYDKWFKSWGLLKIARILENRGKIGKNRDKIAKFRYFILFFLLFSCFSIIVPSFMLLAPFLAILWVEAGIHPRTCYLQRARAW